MGLLKIIHFHSFHFGTRVNQQNTPDGGCFKKKIFYHVEERCCDTLVVPTSPLGLDVLTGRYLDSIE